MKVSKTIEDLTQRYSYNNPLVAYVRIHKNGYVKGGVDVEMRIFSGKDESYDSLYGPFQSFVAEKTIYGDYPNSITENPKIECKVDLFEERSAEVVKLMNVVRKHMSAIDSWVNVVDRYITLMRVFGIDTMIYPNNGYIVVNGYNAIRRFMLEKISDCGIEIPTV